MTKKAYLVLSDGKIFQGRSFGFEGETQGEVVFNTSITGYQEILTDPSYHGQIVTMTYPHIGNYGCNPEDMESDKVQTAGFVVRSYCDLPSSWRARETLAQFLKRHKIVAGTGFDTRTIVQYVRDNGAKPALLITADELPGDAVLRAAALPSMSGQDLASKVTCSESYVPVSCFMHHASAERSTKQDARSMRQNKPVRVVLYDFGVKLNIVRMLQARGCDVAVVPAQTTAKDVLSMKPDGVLLSNGPGDPAAVTYAIENIKQLLGRLPIFGICLGHQILALALGCKTYKLKFGHRGGNQPVKNLRTGKVEITSQNHGFAVDGSDFFPLCKGELEGVEHSTSPSPSLQRRGVSIEITHINLNDNTVEGLAVPKLKAFSVQYHPEASPGPHDSHYLFDEFVRKMKQET
ncbi:MAG: carbamoyl phosphate synthase small subunit [Deltaproteobacteria bacterium CG11_big_fil_rev_8_21_14_0_20_49_13]|nr:MAG: carbamoyl phosphate synthase small subunit [Deltaproteobacteria bacterium CG11_big_fil_rev_8_21_14_0_20_49_13]